MISRHSLSAVARSPCRLASAARSNKVSSADCAMPSLLRCLFGRHQPIAEIGERALRHQWLLLAAIAAGNDAGRQRREEPEIHVHRLEADRIGTASDVRHKRAERRGRWRRRKHFALLLGSCKSSGEQADRGAFDIALDAGDLAGEAEIGTRFETQTLIEQLRAIDEGIAM